MASMSLGMVMDVFFVVVLYIRNGVLCIRSTFLHVQLRYSAQVHARICVPIRTAIVRHLYIMIFRGDYVRCGGITCGDYAWSGGTVYSAVYGGGGGDRLRRGPPTA